MYTCIDSWVDVYRCIDIKYTLLAVIFNLLSPGWCTYFHDYKSMIWTNPLYGTSVDTILWKVVNGY